MHIVSRPDPRDLSDEDLYDAIFSSGVFLIDLLPDLCRGWQLGHPHGSLGVLLSTAACASPQACVRTGIGKNPSPLNMISALMAASGGGKGLMTGGLFETSVPRPVVPAVVNGVPVVGGSASAGPINTVLPGDIVIRKTPASGEAAVTMFYEKVVNPDPSGKPPMIYQRHPHAVLSEWDEIDAFAAKAIPGKSTLEPGLRSGWSGAQIGDGSISREMSGIPQFVAARSYRWVILIGGQYLKAHALLGTNAAAGGTAQRIDWLRTDMDTSRMASTPQGRRQQRIEARKRVLAALGIPIPANERDLLALQGFTIKVPGPGDRVIDLSPAVQDMLQDMREMSGSLDPLDTHVGQLTARRASLFAGLRSAQHGGSLDVEPGDWFWSMLCTEASRRVRERTAKICQAADRAQARETGELRGVADLAANIVKAKSAQRVGLHALERLRQYVGQHPGVSKRVLQQSVMNASTRGIGLKFDVLLNDALARELVTRDEHGLFWALDDDLSVITTPVTLEPLGLEKEAESDE